jgi:glutamate synthase domain-containing protein 3
VRCPPEAKRLAPEHHRRQYGAVRHIAGSLFQGVAGERFAVRNSAPSPSSKAPAITPEYMTGGVVAVLATQE